ncbi:MAG: glycoside hydrolase family 88 protein [Lachnospiraceae bacterium]|nr:glycoside hydrolase family 88 protein [Lachnospiraceae bacterium]
MINKMLNQAQYELLHYPYYSIGDHLSRPFRALFSKNYKPHDRFGFANGLLAKALMDYYKKHVNTEEGGEALDVVKRYYNRWISRGCKIRSISDVYSGMALIDLHQLTGQDKYKKGLDKIMKYLFSIETDDFGSVITYPERKDKMIYADSLGMICPFLAKYGERYNDMNSTNLAVVMIQNYMNYGMEEKLLLPYQCYDPESKMKYGIIGWGMSVGRLLMGMSETLYYMEPERQSYEQIKQYYRRIVDKVETYQSEGGLYHWQLSAKEGPADTGATSMILYSIAQSLEDKILIGIHKSRMMRGIEALKVCIQDDGTLPGASKDTDKFNEYPIDFGSYPWALGPALSLFLIMEDEIKVNTNENIIL